jgi:hypothetical protein
MLRIPAPESLSSTSHTKFNTFIFKNFQSIKVIVNMLTSSSQVEYGIVILCKSINKYMTAILYPILNYLNQNFRTKEKLRSTQHIDQLVKYKIQNHNLFHSRHTHPLPFIIPRNKFTPFPFFGNPILTKFYPIKNNTIWPYPPYYQWMALKNKPL